MVPNHAVGEVEVANLTVVLNDAVGNYAIFKF
jgi:hypothetical protein